MHGSDVHGVLFECIDRYLKTYLRDTICRLALSFSRMKAKADECHICAYLLMAKFQV